MEEDGIKEEESIKLRVIRGKRSTGREGAEKSRRNEWLTKTGGKEEGREQRQMKYECKERRRKR